MTRALTLLAALAAVGGPPVPAAAQTTGDPFPFLANATPSTVFVLGGCDNTNRHIVYGLGGASVLASSSPGGPLLASVPLPAGTLSAEDQANYCPSLVVPGPPPGTYWILMVYGLTNMTSAPPSAWRQVVVAPRTCVGVPLPPVLSSNSPVINGTSIALGFSGSAAGCAIDRIDLEVGTTPGGTEIGVYPLPGLDTFFPNVPPGTYYTRARGVNAHGRSNRSTEIPLQIPGPCSPGALPPTPIAPTVSVNGRQVTISWTLATSGATFHQLTLIDPAGFAPLDYILLPGATSVSASNVPPGNYRVRISSGNGCGMRAMSSLSYLDFTVH
ncbi:MAG: hypothetical protein R2745_01320 [Vicinamibacterales bacterium]